MAFWALFTRWISSFPLCNSGVDVSDKATYVEEITFFDDLLKVATRKRWHYNLDVEGVEMASNKTEILQSFDGTANE